MANTDRLVALAEHIAGSLRGVSRNEWMRWVQVAHSTDINRAIRYAQRLSQDETMRPSQQRAHRFIASTMQQFKTEIQQLGEDETKRLYGFVAWELVVRRG